MWHASKRPEWTGWSRASSWLLRNQPNDVTANPKNRRAVTTVRTRVARIAGQYRGRHGQPTQVNRPAMALVVLATRVISPPLTRSPSPSHTGIPVWDGPGQPRQWRSDGGPRHGSSSKSQKIGK